MITSRIFRRRNLALLALLVLVTGAVYGFAAANTVQDSAAGDGYAPISGYAVTNINYTLNATNPTMIDAVTFDLANIDVDADDPSSVKAKLVNSGGAWSSACSPTVNTWTCSFTGTGGVSVLAADELRVVAVQ